MVLKYAKGKEWELTCLELKKHRLETTINNIKIKSLVLGMIKRKFITES